MEEPKGKLSTKLFVIERLSQQIPPGKCPIYTAAGEADHNNSCLRQGRVYIPEDILRISI